MRCICRPNSFDLRGDLSFNSVWRGGHLVGSCVLLGREANWTDCTQLLSSVFSLSPRVDHEKLFQSNENVPTCNLGLISHVWNLDEMLERRWRALYNIRNKVMLHIILVRVISGIWFRVVNFDAIRPSSTKRNCKMCGRNNWSTSIGSLPQLISLIAKCVARRIMLCIRCLEKWLQ